MNYLEKAKIWRDNPKLDAKLRVELEAMDDAALKDAFTNDLEFGTAGMRGILGVGTSKMNVHVVAKATLGFGRYLLTFVQ